MLNSCALATICRFNFKAEKEMAEKAGAALRKADDDTLKVRLLLSLLIIDFHF